MRNKTKYYGVLSYRMMQTRPDGFRGILNKFIRKEAYDTQKSGTVTC